MKTKRKGEERVKEGNGEHKRNKSSEIMWVLIVMGVLIVSILVVYFVIQSMKHFTCEGLDFSKIKYGKLDLYYYYHYFNKDGQTYMYNLYLRGDPRDNKVPVEGGEIAIYGGKRKYISVNYTGLSECPDLNIAVDEFVKLFTDNLIVVKAATPDMNEAQSKNMSYVNCETNTDDMIFQLEKGDKTRVFAENRGRCYKIQVAKCEDLLNAVEKFVVRAISDAKKAGSQ